jgi:predicted TPR repeat methyltransferase
MGSSRRKTRRRKRPRGTIGDCFQAALCLYRGGRLAEAEDALRQLLRARADHPEALHLLGLLSHRKGDAEEAIELIRESVCLKPDYAAAQNDLGNVLHEAGRLDEAAEVFSSLIALRPDYAHAHNNLGIVLKNQGKLAEAVAAYQKAIDLDPGNAGARVNLGNALSRQGRFPEAADAYRRAVELAPDNTDAHRRLAGTLRMAGRLDEAQEVLEQLLRQEPDDPIASHMLAACRAGEVPSRASDAYVQQLFDQFAGTFDEHLRGLDYRVPQLIAAAIAEEPGTAAGSLDVLDAGCGTGLCGLLLRPYAATLVGVDLSPAMLEKAQRLGVYEDLVTAELTAYLKEHALAFDLVVAADVLVYFGALGPVLAAAAGALRNGGWIVFTLEEDQGQPSEAGYRLNPHGRYCHREDYVKRCLADAGLVTRCIAADVLRTEADRPVAGLVVRACKCPAAEAAVG